MRHILPKTLSASGTALLVTLALASCDVNIEIKSGPGPDAPLATSSEPVVSDTADSTGAKTTAADPAPDDALDVFALKVEGMTCEHCVASVTETLKATKGVQSVKVSLDEGSAMVVCRPEAHVSVSSLVESVNKLGFTASTADSK